MDRKSGTAETQTAGVPQEVERLIAAGKGKQAVELAKTEHKRLNTAASERLLVDAYLARIEQFQNKGATQDAQTLLNLVRQRFPGHQGRLGGLVLRSAAAEGNIEALIAPLARDDVPPEERSLIESILRRKLTDPSRLAACPALRPDHPLRSAAAALDKALAAAATGPVTDEQISLPEISRSSPLADWKMLVRALAAFHRDGDDLCRRNLSVIPQDSAVRPAADVLLAAIDHAPPLPGRSGALQARIASDDKPLRQALVALDAAFNSQYLEILEQAMRAALQACSTSHPEFLDNLRQRISVRCAMEDVPVKAVLKVMGPARKDSVFWRLLARSAEMQQTPQAAAVFWDRFRLHAIAEGMFSPSSLEDAAVQLHAASSLAGSYSPPSADLRLFRHIRDYYNNQPDEIARLIPKNPGEVNDATDVSHLLRRVVEIDPHPSAFSLWHTWALGSRMPERQVQELAELWHRKLPAEPKPLLVLSQLAEERKALKLALKYLSQAETLDPMNPDGRKARLRLTLSTAWKHFTDRKPHLVQQDLEALSGLPAMSEGDRPALLEAMRAAWHAIAGASFAAQAAADRTAQLAGPIMAPHLLESIKELIRYPHENPPHIPELESPDPLAVAEAESRIIRLTRATRVPIYRPRSWSPLIDRVLGQNPCPLPEAALLDIAFGEVVMEEWDLAYRASAAGLGAAKGTSAAWFLLRRAQSLPEWAGRRATQCLRAALELSRQSQDPQLAAEVAKVIDRIPEAQDAVNGPGGRALGEELLEKVLKSERAARNYPRNERDAEKHVVALAVPVAYDQDDSYAEGEDEFGDPFDDQNVSSLLQNVSPEMLEEIIRTLGMPMPRRGEPLNPKLVSRVASVLSDLLFNGGGLDSEPERPGILNRIFGRGRRSKR